jgi:hypothetical protein
MAPLTVVCPDTYSGKFGVAMSGVQPDRPPSRIAILVGALDRRDRTPEIEGILRVPTRDPRVGACDVHEREITSRLRFVEAETEHDLTEHGVPIERGRRQPESCDVGLLGGPGRTVQRTDFLHLIQSRA